MSSLDREALQILEAALDAEDETARKHVIATRCGGDELLRTRVELLLVRHESATRLLPTDSFVAPRDILMQLPERVGPYRLTGEIARGGMGAVVKAERDDGVFQQQVAIKLIRSDIASERSRRRFEEERRILARLRHPHIVRILDGGEQGNQPWLVMDYVEGAPVTQVLRNSSWTRRQRLQAFESICDAVAYAHRQLVVHADIKPSNVLMSADGRVHLLDFGIARLMVDLDGDESGDPYPLTRGYAAPERGVGVVPTIASDVFSLGVLLVEMLTGVAPNADADAVAGMLLQRGLLQGDIAAIAARALSAEPQDRYPDVGSLQEDIRRLCADLPVLARRDAGLRYHIGKFVRRHRVAVAASAAMVIALAGAAALSTAQWLSANRARAEADTRFNEVRDLSHFLLFDLYDQLSLEPGTVQTRAQVAELAQRYLGRLRAVPHAPFGLSLETAAAYRRLAQVVGVSGAASLGRPEEARALLAQAELILQSLLREQPGNAEVLESLGWVYADRWTLLVADATSDRVNLAARHYFDAALAIEPARIAARIGRLNTQRCEAYVLIKGTDEPKAAEAVLARTLAELHALQVPVSLSATAALVEYQTLSNLGDAVYYGGESWRSLPHYQAALAIAESELRTHGTAPAWLTRRSEALWNISGILEEDRKRWPEALAAVESGIVSLQRALDFGPDADAEKKLSVLFSQQGMLLARMQRGVRAIEAMERSVAIREKRLAAAPGDGARLRDLTIGRMSFADVLAELRQRERACAVARLAREMWMQIEQRGELTVHDRNSNAAQAAAAADRYCARGMPPR